MNNNPVRILKIISVMNRGGIESQIMSLYRKIDRNKYQFDFLVTRNEKGVFDEEIISLGGKIYNINGVREVGIFRFIKSINDFFKKHKEFKIVHCHMNTWSGLFLNIARINNVPIRIAHSHSAQKGVKASNFNEYLEMKFKNIMKRFIKFGATHFWSVGYDAGEWLYGKKIVQKNMRIFPNSKDFEIYKYNIESRINKRVELGIQDDEFLIGHVGNFSPVKNHKFLIELMEEIEKETKKYKLCLVGDGRLKKQIEMYTKEKNLCEKVIFLGARNDVDQLMSAFDILLLPSKFEGIPNVIIEGQLSGLQCIISDSISKDVDMGIGCIEFLSLDKNKWKNTILEKNKTKRNIDLQPLKNKGYDINNQILELEDFYSNILKSSR